MCLTRVGRVIDVEGATARIRFLDGPAVREVDASMVDARPGSYVEVFADAAIRCITKREAEFKRDLRLELLERARGAPA